MDPVEENKELVSVFWDADTCPLLGECHPSEIPTRIEKSLRDFQYNGQVSISVYGTFTNMSDRVRTDIRNVASLHMITCGGKQTANKSITHDIQALLLNHGEETAKINCMLITGDKDFADLLHRLKLRREFNILLVHPDRPTMKLSDCSFLVLLIPFGLLEIYYKRDKSL